MMPAPHAAELQPTVPTGASPWGEHLQRTLHSTRTLWQPMAPPVLGTTAGPQKKSDSSWEPVTYQRLQPPPGTS